MTPHVQRLGVSDALDYFADKANNIPGFRMFTVVLGVNPINMNRVERSAANILRAVVEFLPGGGLITQALDNYGIFDKIGNWIEGQIRSLGMTGSLIRDAINRFLDTLSWTDIFNLGDVWRRAVRIFSEPIDRIIAFVRGLATGILGFIKDAILRPLAGLASQTRGWDLLKAVLGRDPITGDPVPRTADTLIGGFMKLIGQEEVWENLKRANAVARAWAWFQSALSELMGFVGQIPGLFLQALQSLEIMDLVLLPRAFIKVGRVFADFVGRFISWAGGKVMNLLEIIFEVLAPAVMPYIRKAAGALRTIIANPIGFIGNLVRAGIQGFRQFGTNFLTHLRTSLVAWLTGTLSGANIHIPQAFTLVEILKFVLSVLGLTWQNIRQKLVKVIGETAVKVLETGFDLVMTLVTEGPAAAWQKILEGISNLREMVMEQIMTFVRDRIVQAAITKLVTSLNPAGAFIQAVIAIYNTIMFFVERLKQIAQVAAAFIDSIAAIASGVIAAAANRVEQTMAGLLTLVISFLARIAGLGKVSDAVIAIINKVRAPIDKALDRVVDWIVAQARKLGKLITGKTDPAAPGTAGAADAGIITEAVSMHGQAHTLKVDPATREVTLASKGGRAEAQVDAATARVRALPQNDLTKAALRAQAALKAKIEAIYKKIDANRNVPRPDLREMNRLVQQLKDAIGGYGDEFKVDDITDPLPGFGPATGGLHPAVTIDAGKVKTHEQDGSARESHHVPPKEAAKSMKTMLLDKAKELGKKRTGEKAADLLKARANKIKVEGDGPGLSAVSIHRVTHQNAGGAAVHSAAAAEDIIKAVEQAEKGYVEKTIIIRNRVAGTLAVNPTADQWDAWIEEVRKQVEARPAAASGRGVVAQAAAEATGEKRSKAEQAAQAVVTAADAVLTAAYSGAFTTGMAAMQNALNASVLDGTPEQRAAALAWLRANARASWVAKGVIAA